MYQQEIIATISSRSTLLPALVVVFMYFIDPSQNWVIFLFLFPTLILLSILLTLEAVEKKEFKVVSRFPA